MESKSQRLDFSQLPVEAFTHLGDCEGFAGEALRRKLEHAFGRTITADFRMDADVLRAGGYSTILMLVMMITSGNFVAKVS